jgi:hypothetical protein
MTKKGSTFSQKRARDDEFHRHRVAMRPRPAEATDRLRISGRKQSSPRSNDGGSATRARRSKRSVRATGRAGRPPSRRGRARWRAAPFRPPALVPEMTSTRGSDRVNRRSLRHVRSSARTSRLSSSVTPPIHTARLTPPVMTTAMRSSMRSSASNWLSAIRAATAARPSVEPSTRKAKPPSRDGGADHASLGGGRDAAHPKAGPSSSTATRMLRTSR